MKADAEIVCELAETGIEYASAGGQTTIDYTTNMGDVYDYSVTYGEPDAGEWLTWSDEGAGRVVLRAAEWTSKSDNRTGGLHHPCRHGRHRARRRPRSPVVQLRVDDYYYLYGASVPRYEAIDAALPDDQAGGGSLYGRDLFRGRRDESRAHQQGQPHGLLSCYVLAAGGTVAEIASAEAPLPRRARNRRRRVCARSRSTSTA